MCLMPYPFHLYGRYRFEGVTFGYEPSRTILNNNIHLTIRAGETVAFVGPSGAERPPSAAFSRFYDVDQGTITVDGIDIRNIKLQNLRKHIGIVQAGCVPVLGTIRDNIAYGDLHATDQQIWGCTACFAR